jgi:hypothetical protein
MSESSDPFLGGPRKSVFPLANTKHGIDHIVSIVYKIIFYALFTIFNKDSSGCPSLSHYASQFTSVLWYLIIWTAIALILRWANILETVYIIIVYALYIAEVVNLFYFFIVFTWSILKGEICGALFGLVLIWLIINLAVIVSIIALLTRWNK